MIIQLNAAARQRERERERKRQHLSQANENLIGSPISSSTVGNMVLAITFPGQLLYHSLFDFFSFFILLLLVVVLLPSLLWLVGLVGAEVFSL